MPKIKPFHRKNHFFNLAPTRTIVISFFFIILAGTLLLMLPISSNSGKNASFFDAFFTSTSATCVTGLVVVDTLTQWSTFGQIVILLLIQTGGIGLITFATFFSILLGRKVGLKGMILAQESLNHFSYEDILKLVKKVVLAVLAVEILGALVLSIRFVPLYGARGLYMGLFHSVSAFCNAGFDLMGDYLSFTQYNHDPLVLYTLAGLIIIGGLGFIVWKDLYEFFKKRSPLLLHTKVVLTITSFLIIGGAITFFLFEQNNSSAMGNLNFPQKVNASVFHSVASRTAGFNTLPLSEMSEVSKLMTTILMFIGAAPGSTAGGVKVTTLSIIIIAIISQIKGSGDILIFKRRVSYNTVNKSLAIIGLAAVWVVVVTILILAIEKSSSFIDILYEVTSAFGTVGLSSVGTPTLSIFSKLLLIITMFLGRVGPISFAIALTLRANRSKPDLVYPEGKIVVG